MSADWLALIEATDRHGSVRARLPVTQWPVTAGRELGCDLVLDDAHVAAQHLRLEQGAAGHVTVQVLDTNNGVALGRRQHHRGTRFDWPAGEPLLLGRTHLHLRLAHMPVPHEQRLPQLPWRSTLWTLAAVAMVLALMLGQLWLGTTQTSRLVQELPTTLLGTLAGLGIWAGLWALATKLFSGHPQFWRHVRIACVTYLAAYCVDGLIELLAFMFSWENLARFGYLATLLVLALGVHRHLRVVAPQRRRGLAVGVALLLALGVPTILGTQWLKSKRLSSQLYMSQLFPPDWRVAAPVPVAQFVHEAASIERRLAVRLKDREDEDASDKSPDAD